MGSSDYVPIESSTVDPTKIARTELASWSLEKSSAVRRLRISPCSDFLGLLLKDVIVLTKPESYNVEDKKK